MLGVSVRPSHSRALNLRSQSNNVISNTKIQTSTNKSIHSTPKSLGEHVAFKDKAFQLEKGTEIKFPTEHFDHYRRESNNPNSNRAFSYLVVGTAGATYAAAAKNGIWSVIGQMAPSADVLALANIEVDLSTIPEGNTVTIKWRGKPLFIRHRTQEEIETAKNTPLTELPDPQKDEDRVKTPEWLVLLGVCTHLGCVPLANQGDYSGWFCPCHGSHYDVSGRIRKGPAPLNLEIPPYKFMDDSHIIVGVSE